MNLKELLDLNLDNKLIFLENINGDKLGTLNSYIQDVKFSPRYNSISTLSFKVFDDCPCYKQINSWRRILVQDTMRFIIEKPLEHNNGLVKYKEVTCRSLEIDINRKTVPLLQGTYKFYSPTTNENTIVKNIMEYLPNWTIESVSSDLWNVFRSFDLQDRPLLQLIQEDISNTFECVWEFDTIEQSIKIKTFDDVPKNSDIYLSLDNVVKELNITEDTESLITSINVSGTNGLDIRTVNPLGNVIYNFQHFATIEYMSEDLVNAINSWQTLISSRQAEYSNYLLQRKAKIAERITLETELTELKSQLKALTETRNALLDAGLNATSKNNEVKLKQTEINNKETAINNKQVEISNIDSALENIQNTLSLKTYFTQSQLLELEPFIINISVTDENFTKVDTDTDLDVQETAQELYDKYKRYLDKNSKIKYKFSIDLINFVPFEEYKAFTSQLDWGVKVNLETEYGIAQPMLLGLDITLDEETDVQFLFSEDLRYEDSAMSYEDYISNKLSNVSNMVTGSSVKWNKYENSGAKKKLEDIFNEGLKADLAKILDTDKQELTITEQGLLGRKYVSEGIYEDEQIKLTNNRLGFTTDGWNNLATVLGKITLPNGSTAFGLNAEVILGKLGKFVQVEANQVYVGDSDLVEYIDNLDFDSDKFVEKDKLYNMTKISTEGGIQVFDINGKERVQIGNYTVGKYGIEIKDKTGSTTILDESGTLQTWQEANVDNVDAENPLKLYVYIPSHTNVVNKAILRFKMEKFRAYSKSIESGGDVVKSSEANDIMVAVTGLATDVDEQTVNTSWAGDPEHYHSFIKTIHHKHNIEIEPHDHTIDIPPHTHGIQYGIYESSMPTNIRVYINGVDYSSYLGATSGYFNTDQPELDITSLVEIGKWNEVALYSSSLGRIDASVFIQAFIQTVRKSIITDKYFVSNTEIGRANSLGRTSSVIIRTDFTKPAQGLYRFSLEGSKGVLYYMDLNTKVTSALPRYEVSNIKDLSLAVDGRWIFDKDKNGYLLKTDSEPYMFWVDINNKLYVKKLNSSQEPYLLAENVKYVSSIRAWKNVNVTTADHGILAVYIKSDGLVYYRNYTEQSLNMFSWETERQIAEFTGTAVRVNLFNTNDYRTGIFIEDSSGDNKYLLTGRNWAGMAIPAEKIVANPYEIHLDLIELNYENGYEDIHLKANPYEIKLDLLFSSTENSILSAENKPNENVDWGWVIEFEVQNPIPELLLGKITVIDVLKSTPITMTSVQSLGENKYRLTASNVIESGFNNVLGDIKIDITNVINEAGYTYENMSYTFTPVNLVPTDIPIPEVVEVWNE